MSSVDRLPGRMSEPPERKPPRCPVHDRPMKRAGRGLFRCVLCDKTWSEADLRSAETS
jgi:tRNA(Ile2) C34 agmatinyltransferase TiaS